MNEAGSHAGDAGSVVPVWTLATSKSTRLPALTGAETLTPSRLIELRSALAVFADSPIVTLEAHPLAAKLDRTAGIALDALSPLAQHLSQLVSRTAATAPAAANVQATGEVLYRMVVPAKHAAAVGKGVMAPMKAAGVPQGIHSALVGSSGIAGQAVFQPVAGAAAAGGAAGAAGTAGLAAAGAGALTVAAPLVLMAIAVGASAHAERQRQQAIERMTGLLEKLHHERLEAERGELDGCLDAIEKATAVLLDEGKVGPSLGLDSAVHAIGTAIAHADRRLRAWQKALDGLAPGAVDIGQLEEAFPGLEEDGGEFRAQLELAALAIALRRRVVVLQAVEHSQSDADNPFINFSRSMQSDHERVDRLEAGITSVLIRLSALELRSPSRLRDRVMTRGQVDELLAISYRLRALGEGLTLDGPARDVVIDIARHADGSLQVFPAAVA